MIYSAIISLFLVAYSNVDLQNMLQKSESGTQETSVSQQHDTAMAVIRKVG